MTHIQTWRKKDRITNWKGMSGWCHFHSTIPIASQFGWNRIDRPVQSYVAVRTTAFGQQNKQELCYPLSFNTFFIFVKLVCSAPGLVCHTSAFIDVIRRSPLRILPANILLLVAHFSYLPFFYTILLSNSLTPIGILSTLLCNRS